MFKNNIFLLKLNIALFLKTFVFKYSHSLKCKSSILCLVAVVTLWNESSRSDCSKEYRAALRSPAKCWHIPRISQEMSLQCWGIDFPWLTTVCRSFKADCISIVLFMCLQQKIFLAYITVQTVGWTMYSLCFVYLTFVLVLTHWWNILCCQVQYPVL